MAVLASQFSTIAGTVIQVSDFVDGKEVLYARITQPTLHPCQPVQDCCCSTFRTRQWRGAHWDCEGHLFRGRVVDHRKQWCCWYWSSWYRIVYYHRISRVPSVLCALQRPLPGWSCSWEDLHKHSLLFKHHTKITKHGNVFVRRLVYGGADVKEMSILTHFTADLLLQGLNSP